MPTGADKAHDTELMEDSFSVDKASDGTAITGMDTAGTLSAAAWTVLSSGRNPCIKDPFFAIASSDASECCFDIVWVHELIPYLLYVE